MVHLHDLGGTLEIEREARHADLDRDERSFGGQQGNGLDQPRGAAGLSETRIQEQNGRQQEQRRATGGAAVDPAGPPLDYAEARYQRADGEHRRAGHGHDCRLALEARQAEEAEQHGAGGLRGTEQGGTQRVLVRRLDLSPELPRDEDRGQRRQWDHVRCHLAPTQ